MVCRVISFAGITGDTRRLRINLGVCLALIGQDSSLERANFTITEASRSDLQPAGYVNRRRGKRHQSLCRCAVSHASCAVPGHVPIHYAARCCGHMLSGFGSIATSREAVLAVAPTWDCTAACAARPSSCLSAGSVTRRSSAGASSWGQFNCRHAFASLKVLTTSRKFHVFGPNRTAAPNAAGSIMF